MNLTTGKVKNKLHEVTGLTIQTNDKATLVEIATNPPTKNNCFCHLTSLPNEALAERQCN